MARRYSQVVNEFSLFPAKVTARDGSGNYSFQEQIFDSTGAYTDMDSGRHGDATNNPARERNDVVLTTFPFFTLMRQRGVVDGTPLYEFERSKADDGAPGICDELNTDTEDIRVVTNVCPTITEDVVTAIEVEYRTLTVPRCLVTAGARECVTNPTGCCPEGGYTCGCTTSNTLCFSWADAGVGGQVRLDGDTVYDNLDSFPMTMIADCQWAGSTVLPPEKIVGGTVGGPVNVDVFFGVYDGGGGSWFVCFGIRMWTATQYPIGFIHCMDFEEGFGGGILPNTMCPDDPIHQEYAAAQDDGLAFGEPFFEWGNHIDEGACP